jgi:hypothetical protein
MVNGISILVTAWGLQINIENNEKETNNDCQETGNCVCCITKKERMAMLHNERKMKREYLRKNRKLFLNQT